MDDHLHKDPLEQYFKKAFEQDQDIPADDDWDVPSDEVWTNIDEQLPMIQPKGVLHHLPGKWWYWAAAAGIIAILSYQLFSNKLELEEMADQVATNTKVIDELKQKTAELETNATTAPLVNTDQEKAANNSNTETFGIGNNSGELADEQTNVQQLESLSSPISNSQPEQAIVQEEPDELSPAKTNDTSSEPTLSENEKLVITNDQKTKTENAVPLTEPANTANHLSKIEQTGTNVSLPNSDKKILEAIALLDRDILFAKAIETSSPPALLAGPIVPVHRINSPRGFYAGAYVAPGRTYRALRIGNQLSRFQKRLLNEQEVYGTSIKTGLDLGYRLSSKWSLETGLAYAKSSIKSRHRHQLRYNRNGERPRLNGDFENDYMATLLTSYGEVETDLALTRASNTSIDHLSFVNLDFTTQQSLEFIQVPLVLRYHGGRGPLRLNAKAGLAANFLIRDQVEFISARSLRPGTGAEQPQRHQSKSFQGLNKTTIDYVFGLGASLQVGKHLQLLAEPTFSQSINPIYDKGDIRTYPVSFSLQMGARYYF